MRLTSTGYAEIVSPAAASVTLPPLTSSMSAVRFTIVSHHPVSENLPLTPRPNKVDSERIVSTPGSMLAAWLSDPGE